MTFALAVALALVSSAQPAPKAQPQPPLPQGNRLELGQKAFNEGQLDLALRLLDAAAAESPDIASAEKIQLLRGQCLAARQDFGKAEEAFSLALDANPEASLDPGKVDPAVVKLLESMRARMSGTLIVTTTPAGAGVTVDGKDAGKTPVTLNTSIGRHRVQTKWPEAEVGPTDVLVRNKRETQLSYVAVTVEKKVIVKEEVPVVAPPPPPPKARIFLDARVGADLNAGPEGGLDLGVGIELPVIFLRAELAARVYPYFHIIPRLAGVIPLAAKDFDIFVEVGLPIRFPSSGLVHGGAAFHAGAGAEWNATNILAIYAEVGGTFYFWNPDLVVDDRFTAAAGLRLRFP